jgi:hypothetical protein
MFIQVSSFRKACLRGGPTLVVLFLASAAIAQDPLSGYSPPLAGLYQGATLPADREPLPVPNLEPSMFRTAEDAPTSPPASDSETSEDPVVCVDAGPWYSRWPVIGSIHRRWVTHTKPALQASHWGYPENFIERPFGSDVLQAEQMQIVNGLKDQQVLYHYDFLPDQPATLSPRGRYQLLKIVRRMEIATAPIVIQTAITNPELDNARRDHVIAVMQQAGVDVVPEMVVVDYPPLPGLQGTEGMLIYNNLLGQTQDRGSAFGGGGGGSGAGVVVPVVPIGNGE